MKKRLFPGPLSSDKEREPPKGQEAGVTADWDEMDLEALLDHGREQTANLTFYKLVFQALEQLAHQNSPTAEVYRASFLALSAGFLSSVKPEYLPQAVAAKNLLFRKASF